MNRFSEKRLRQIHIQLTQLFLAARTLEHRVRIDGALAHVQELLVDLENRRLRHAVAQLPARLQTQTALLAELQRIRDNGGAWVEEAIVERVIDGDTILLGDGERVRYIGMDAPELNNGPGKNGVAEPYSTQAMIVNQQLVQGRRIRMMRDSSERDRYGRLLRYVFHNGTFINAQLVLLGLARLYTLPPDTRFAHLLARCEAHARSTRIGMWRRDR